MDLHHLLFRRRLLAQLGNLTINAGEIVAEPFAGNGRLAPAKAGLRCIATLEGALQFGKPGVQRRKLLRAAGFQRLEIADALGNRPGAPLLGL